MFLAQVLSEQRHSEVDLAAARTPNEPFLDQAVAVYRDAALIARAVGRCDIANAVRRIAGVGDAGSRFDVELDLYAAGYPEAKC